MTPRASASLLTALGFSPDQDRIYHQALANSGCDVGTLATACQLSEDELLRQLAGLSDEGIVCLEGGHVNVLPPAESVRLILERQAEKNAQNAERLHMLSSAVLHLGTSAGSGVMDRTASVSAIDGEVSSGGNPLDLITELVEHNTGDLCWWRPDQWRTSRDSAMAQMVARAIASGRTSRAIYPVRALWESPDSLKMRAQFGEQIRVVPEVPTRLLVLGSALIAVPEPFGSSEQPRLVIRQRAVVQGFAMLFEMLWEGASPVPELELGDPRPDLRRLLLQQLSAGAKDEQIARTLGISLRTVRRRIANLLIELGVDSRFQAGVEAVRRGWL